MIKKMLKLVVATYVVIQVVKVAPVIIKGVAWIAEGATNGVTSKIAKHISKEVFPKREKGTVVHLHHGKYSSYTEFKKQKCEGEA